MYGFNEKETRFGVSFFLEMDKRRRKQLLFYKKGAKIPVISNVGI